MAINTLEYAKIFQTTLDEQLIAGATSGWMEANAGQVRYSGGNEVKIPKISTSGLGEYDRDDGYPQGGVSLVYETKTLTQDRARKFQLDAMDVDETNFVVNASTVMANFQQSNVIPEIDAYRYSTIAAIAASAGQSSVSYNPAANYDVYEKLKTDITTLQDAIGESYDLVITMSIPCASILEQSDRISRSLDVVDFQRGEIFTKVRAIDGIPIIKVTSRLLKTAYVFNDGTTAGQTQGGFTPAAGAKQINWLITARKAPIAVSKTDTVRIFDPTTNQKANAWQIDYRKYHDLWIFDNAVKGVWANIGA
jgi:hypothetical protein